jgi:hypothetical protein
MVIFLPLIIAYNSSCKAFVHLVPRLHCRFVSYLIFYHIAFWLKENITYEQPTVTYKYNTMIQMQGESTSPLTAVTDRQLSLFYSTSPTVNSLYSDYVRYPLLQSNEVDTNLDGKVDRIEINIQMPVQSYESVHDINCLIFHDVQFNGKSKLLIDAVSHVSYSSVVAVSEVLIDGDLQFRQTWPLAAKGG